MNLACILTNNAAKLILPLKLSQITKDPLVKITRESKWLPILVMKIAIFLKELQCSTLGNHQIVY